tara:strand:- start:2830 stop:3456 length:627 start_codon:yes stop_codon:yes gene_type:complete
MIGYYDRFLDLVDYPCDMAKRASDLILRDRLQFTLDGTGDLAVNYGRIDLSDYVNVVRDEGLQIKEITYQLRKTGLGSANTCVFDPVLGQDTTSFASMQIFATTTAYENALDVGIASPNVLNNYTLTTTRETNAGNSQLWENQERFRGVYDLHPDGYTVVTDLLIGVAAENCTKYKEETIELDIMIIAEPRKVSKKDLERMLAQATDL